ncbi:MAG: tetratricopeptide repeat protein, partial [Candidatus Hermodarchaeota archaeon]
YLRQKNYPESLEALNKALLIAEKSNNLKEKGKILNNIGLIYKKQEKYIEALSHHKEAYNIFVQLGLQKEIESTRNILGYFKHVLNME